MGVFDWLTRLFVRGMIPREPVVLRPVGVVRNSIREPRLYGWEGVRSDIILREDLLEALEGIEAYSHIIVVFYMHRVPESGRERTQVRPADDERYPLQGVLATRAPSRPNPLGVAVVPLLRRRRNILRVVGLDTIDGTPILDLKPYIPQYDSVPDARLPEWATQPPTDEE